MKLKVLQFYQGWASGENAWEPGDVVDVSDAVIDLPAPDAPDNKWRGSRGEYLLALFPDRFKKHVTRRKKADAEE
jgi:hypothetical protein